MFCYSSINRTIVFTKVVPGKKWWVVDIRRIMIIFKTVLNCIVFNFLGVYCHYINLKVLFFITVMPGASNIDLFDFCHIKRIHIFCFARMLCVILDNMVYTNCSNILCSLSILNKFNTINGCHKTLHYVCHKILKLTEIYFNNNYIIHHHTRSAYNTNC